jgi:RNA polymerase sigma-70 factor (ECF subfamily)
VTSARTTEGNPKSDHVARTGGPNSARQSESVAKWDVATFEESLGRCEDRAYRLAVHLVRDEQTAQGILQATFLSAWRNTDNFASRTQFDAWVYRATVKASLRHLAFPEGQARSSDEECPFSSVTVRSLWCRARAGEDADWAGRAREELRSEELRRRVRETVDSLCADIRTVFILCDLEAMSLENSAEILGLPLAATKQNLQVARLVIHSAISNYFTRGAGGGDATPEARISARSPRVSMLGGLARRPLTTSGASRATRLTSS